jgi:hypothetical protein
MAPSLEHVFTMRLYTSPAKALVIPEAKGNNHRIIAFLTHGHIKGGGFEAELQPGGADWILVCRPFNHHYVLLTMLSATLRQTRDILMFEYNFDLRKDMASMYTSRESYKSTKNGWKSLREDQRLGLSSLVRITG